jgi:hypothetical protein
MTESPDWLSAAWQLWQYLLRPNTWVAVLIPGIASTVILARADRISMRLRLLWMVSLPLTVACMRWNHVGDLHQLCIFSIFSVACLLVLFRRMYISPALIYALTFMSLSAVDLGAAFMHALEYDLPLSTFYYGVGGAGIHDALLIVPAVTAALALYATARLKTTRAPLAEF